MQLIKMKKCFPHISGFLLTLTFVFVVGGLFMPSTLQAHTISLPPSGTCPADHPRSVALTAGESVVQGCGHGTTPEEAQATAYGETSSGLGLVAGWVAGALGWLSVAILKIASYLTYLSGIVLNFVVKYTVVEMKTHLNEATTINTA